MATEITMAEEPARIAREVINAHHADLELAKIFYLFTTQKRKSKGKTVFARAEMANDLLRFFSAADGGQEADFIITISKSDWEAFTDAQREALLDHELCHCQLVDYDKDNEPIWATKGHDLEEFTEVIRRHGLWLPEVKHFAEALQMQLPEPEKAEK